MDNVCAVCFDEMDMKSFEDEQDQTATCFKLECGHAYHTRCIVSCLQRTQHKCPQCNSHKTPENVLSMEGLISEVFREVRKKRELKDELYEYRESKKDFENMLNTLKKDVKSYITTRKEELQFKEKRKRFTDSVRIVRFKFGRLCKEKGPLYAGAYINTPEWRRTRLIFPNGKHIYRRRYPYLYLKL